MCRAYKTVLDASEDKINNEVFNVSYDNKKIIELAKMVKTNTEKFFNKNNIEIEVKSETVDKRSYHVNSDKIKNILGFEAKFSIDDAIISLCQAFKDGHLPNSLSESYINVDTLKIIMSYNHKKTVLITGGAGFIGSHTVDFFVKRI